MIIYVKHAYFNKYCDISELLYKKIYNMKSLSEYILEAKSVALSNWYQDNKYNIVGDQLPQNITKNIKCSIYSLDNSKPISVNVVKNNDNYLLILGNVERIYCTYKMCLKLIEENIQIKTLENCILHLATGGRISKKDECFDIDSIFTNKMLNYFTENNSYNHFSKVIFENFICDECDLKTIAKNIPSQRIEFRNCSGLTTFNFESGRSDLKIQTDKPTINGKLQVSNLLDETSVDIKVVVKKSDLEKIESERERRIYAEKNKWKDNFNFIKLKDDILKSLKNPDIHDIAVYSDSIDVRGDYGVYDEYRLNIFIRLADEKSYSFNGFNEDSIELKLNNDKYNPVQNIKRSKYSPYLSDLYDWVNDKMKNKYGERPSTIIIGCGKELVG